MTFGERLKHYRCRKGMSLRVCATVIGISSTYLTDIEQSKRNPLPYGKIKRIKKDLDLTQVEYYELLDLAAKEIKDIPYDIREYIMNNEEEIIRIRLMLEMK